MTWSLTPLAVFVQSIDASIDGSIYVVGHAGNDGHVAKLGPDGEWDWSFAAAAPTNGADKVVDVVALDDGGAIILIDASHDMTVTPVTGSGEFSTTGDTSTLVRIAADGSFVWHQEMTETTPVSQELSLSADQQTVVALAVGGNTMHVEAFNADIGASIWTRSISGSGTIDSVWGHTELAVNNAGTVVVSFPFYGGTYVVDNVAYDSTSMGNSANGAMQSLFAAFNIVDGSTDWVSYTQKLSSNTTTQAEAQIFELEAAGDKFLATMLVAEGDGTVRFITVTALICSIRITGMSLSVVCTGSWVEKLDFRPATASVTF